MYGDTARGHFRHHSLADLRHSGSWMVAHTRASIVGVSLLTSFHIVVGEMVPRALALQIAEAWSSGLLRDARAADPGVKDFS